MRRYAWLEQEHLGERQRLFDRMLLLLGSLTGSTGWDTDVLLGQLGCRRRTSAQLESLTESDLQRCITFFEWIEDLGQHAPASRTVMRSLVSTAGSAFAGCRGEIDACRRAMQQPIGPGDPCTPSDLLKLGEIGAAFAFARRALPGRMGREARAAASGNPFPDGHVPATTLDLWLAQGEDAYLLAVEQRARLDAHIPRCDRCRSAALRRAAALGLPERPAPALAQASDLLA
ncbi:MAG: hypothetical protein ACR2LK_15705 [Solirubrobacteraceae bacterium]